MGVKNAGLLRIAGKVECTSKTETFCNQVIDSAIVGGITWLSTIATTATIGQPSFSWEGFAIGFCLTFLIKMKDYRKIKD